jgi:hypothetical protein
MSVLTIAHPFFTTKMSLPTTIATSASSTLDPAPKVKVKPSTFQYVGEGYAYCLKKTVSDLTAKLHISRKMLNTFVQRVGAINTTKLPGLTVAEQGGGWYEVFTVNDGLSRQVTNFLKRLNRWITQQKTTARTKRLYHKTFRTVTARVYDHPRQAQFSQTKPVAADTSSLVDMVARFKAKFGK